jgi:4-hydroxythreonine-4-phosphate dehydrogenase
MTRLLNRGDTSQLESMSNQVLPLAVTMGEPAGIGGELVLKCWRRRRTEHKSPFFVIDSPARISSLNDKLGLDVPIREVGSASDVEANFENGLPVIPIDIPTPVEPGCPDPANSSAVMRSIDIAVAAVRNGDATAVVTNPIHKATLVQSGFTYPGHTEYLGALSGIAKPVMMLVGEDLRVVPVTVHVSLKDAIIALTPDAIIHAGKVSAAALASSFGIEHPRLVVAALNPHAGEDNLFGDEEQTIIKPAIQTLRNDGIEVWGPAPADSLFHAAARSTYDAAICMYHDQALIPLKTIDFAGGVNVTLGLPFVRTSPDHGTAFDIAGKGIADENSMLAAMLLASEIAHQRTKIEAPPLSAHG